MKRSHNALASTLLVAGVACGGDSMDPEVTPCTAETGSVMASVTGTAALVFTWEPDCAVTFLLVEHTFPGAGGDVWALESSPEGAVSSPPPKSSSRVGRRERSARRRTQPGLSARLPPSRT